MKKLLGIVVLGLLLSGCATVVDDYYDPDKFVIEIPAWDKKSLKEVKTIANQKCNSLNRGLAINLTHKKKQAVDESLGFRSYSFNCEKSEMVAKEEKKQEEENKKQIELTSMIDKAKDTCKSLSFTEGTEKFSDCALKLYTQSVELAAKNNQQIVSQGLGSNVVTIYDPRRDSRAAIKRGQGLINGTCTLGDLSNC